MKLKVQVIFSVVILLVILSCELPHQELSFSITSYSTSSNYVTAYYTVTNIGNVDIDYYKVYYDVNFSDGSEVSGWTNGLDVLVGKSYNGTIMEYSGGKSVSSIDFTDYEMTVY